MSNIQKKESKKKGSSKAAKASITKRVVVRAAGKGIREASDRAMKTAGYVVKVENGWVVRVDSEGNSKRVKKLSNSSADLALD